MMLSNVAVIEIGYPQVKEYVKKKREIEDREIKSVGFFSNNILD
jgi:PP-loop superfamily ATP-utilizing enzyme